MRHLTPVRHVTEVMDDTSLTTQLDCAYQIRVHPGFGRYQDPSLIKFCTQRRGVTISLCDVAAAPYIFACEDFDMEDRTLH